MGRSLGCKSTRPQTSSLKSLPVKRKMDTRSRMKEIVCYVMFEDEVNVTDNYSILDDPLAVDKWLDPIEIAVMAEKEFGLTEAEWPDEVFQSFKNLLSHLESLLLPSVPVIAQNRPEIDREAHGRL